MSLHKMFAFQRYPHKMGENGFFLGMNILRILVHRAIELYFLMSTIGRLLYTQTIQVIVIR